jgi:hypothetical protein
MKRLTLIAVLAVLTNFVGVADAQTTDKTDKIKAKIARLGTGPKAKIKVVRMDDSKVEGYVVRTDADQFVVMEKRQHETSVAFSDVKQIKGHDSNYLRPILIGFGALTVAVLLFGAALKT